MSRNLEKMTVLITGASGGMGRALTDILVAGGCQLVLVDKKSRKKKSTNDPAVREFYGIDLSSFRVVERFVKILERDRVQLDWVVNFAGWIDQPMPITKQSFANINKTVAANLCSTMYVTRALISRLRSNGGVVNISSTAGLFPNGRYAAYSAAKAGVIAFTRAVARSTPDFSPSDLSFIAVCPGPTNTSMREKLAGDAKIHQSPETIARVIEKIISTEHYRNGDVLSVEKGSTRLVSRFRKI